MMPTTATAEARAPTLSISDTLDSRPTIKSSKMMPRLEKIHSPMAISRK